MRATLPTVPKSRHTRRSRRCLVVLALIVLSACGGGATSPLAPTQPTPPARVTVSGAVTDRVDGSPITGSVIEFNGPEVKTAPVVGGRYEIRDLLSAPYQVRISGSSHVEHRALRIEVGSSTSDLPFSVLGRNSCLYDACYTDDFHLFFDRIARVGYEFGSVLCQACPVRKWDPLPREIYVMRNDTVMSPRAFEAFMRALDEVNAESVPLMFGGRIGPLPIAVGPPIEKRPGTIRVEFFNSPTEHPTGGWDCINNNQVTCGIFRENVFDLERFGYYFGTKNNVLHELYHIAFARHVFTGSGVRDSVMAGSNATTRLTPIDVLASWIVYHPGTKPGNTAPDTNPN